MVMDMDSLSDLQEPKSKRHKCLGCFKQFKRKDHLVEHMKSSYHSFHQPKCAVCRKHCLSFESVREHHTGPLGKSNCVKVFSERGCSLCLKVLADPANRDEHKELCRFSPPVPNPVGEESTPIVDSSHSKLYVIDEKHNSEGYRAVALDCEMVGSGDDGSVDLCARVCLVDEDENLLFHAYVRPPFPITNYRYEVTGLTDDHLKDAIQLDEARDKVLEILYNGESWERVKLGSGNARLLVGHGLEHDLGCLRMKYPNHLLRDTSKYRPLMKTNPVSHSLKYLTKTYLGYDIQTGVHDPYEDCVSVMRLYKRMREQDHQSPGTTINRSANGTGISGLVDLKSKELEKKTPEELYAISRLNYRGLNATHGSLSHPVLKLLGLEFTGCGEIRIYRKGKSPYKLPSAFTGGSKPAAMQPLPRKSNNV